MGVEGGGGGAACGLGWRSSYYRSTRQETTLSDFLKLNCVEIKNFQFQCYGPDT